MDLKEYLASKLPDKYRQCIPRSFDIIGSIAIVEIPNELKKFRKVVGEGILSINKNVRTVYEKASAREGTFRLRKLKYVCGERRSVTVHKENGARISLNVRTCYFSPREGTERMRIAKSIGDERVMVFFAGAGPYPIVISKHSNAKEIVGIEINPKCVTHFKRNIKLNKVSNVVPVLGDVSKVYKNFHDFDRVIMPLPESAWKFLKEAKHVLKRGGIISLYCIFSKIEDEKFWRERISKTLPKAKIISINKVLPFGPGKMKMRIDISV